MATVREVLNKNLELAKLELERFGFKPGKIKIKAEGEGEYRCWCSYENEERFWEEIYSKEQAFDGDEMELMVFSFLKSFTDPEAESVNGHYGSYHDYTFVAGEDTGYLSDSIVSVDCRISNYDEWALYDFWNFHMNEFVPDELDSIIDKEPIVVYHRKGKDWHVSPLIETVECEVYYLDNERDIYYWGDFEGQMAHFVDEKSETVAACVKFIEDCKDNIELKGVAKLLVAKTESMNDFLTEPLDEELLREKAFDFCYEYYAENNSNMGWNNGFNGDFPSINDSEVFEDFLKEFDQFKHQPELALKDSIKLYRLGEKLDFTADFDFIDNVTFSINFNVSNTYSIHVSSEEFIDCEESWTQVYREVVLPQVYRRIEIDQMNSIKRKIKNNLKDFAKNIWVRFEDSLSAGNCKSGSEGFLKRNHISLDKLGAIRGDWLLEMEDSQFTQRIIYSLASMKPELLKLHE